MNDLQKLFISELRAIYDGEQQLVKALADLERAVISGEAKSAFREHLEQTQGQVGRLQNVFGQLDESAQGKACSGIKGIIAEGEMLAAEFAGNWALEPALLGVAQREEHYQISAYGTLCTWAEELGHQPAAGLLKDSLREEKATLTRPTQLVESMPQPPSQPEQANLYRLFFRELRNIYDGEHLLVSALAELEYYAASRFLKLGLHQHLGQTEKHVRRLEKAFSELGETADRKPCYGLEGIIDEAQVSVMEFLGNSALDAALIAAAQKAEHYEIAVYNHLCHWAERLGKRSVWSLLQQNLGDERAADKKLSLVAEWLRNPKARRHESAKRPQETAELLKLATHGG